MMQDISLDMIGVREGTDKSSLAGDYLRHYERILGHLRDKPLQILEIGVASGASLRVWSQFFRLGTFVGVDIGESCRAFANDRVTIEIGSQADANFLDELAGRYQPDVIIDDGSHRSADIFLTFRHLFPALRKGGFYVIEDLYLQYGPDAPKFHTGGPTPAEYFAAVAQRLAANYVEPDCDPQIADLVQSVDGVSFIRNAVVIRKRAEDGAASALDDVWAVAEQGQQPLTWFHLSLSLIQRNDFVRAEQAARNAIRLAPGNPHFYARLAHVQAALGDLPGSVASLERSVELEPGNPGFQNALNYAKSQLKA